MENFWNRDS